MYQMACAETLKCGSLTTASCFLLPGIWLEGLYCFKLSNYRMLDLLGEMLGWDHNRSLGHEQFLKLVTVKEADPRYRGLLWIYWIIVVDENEVLVIYLMSWAGGLATVYCNRSSILQNVTSGNMWQTSCFWMMINQNCVHIEIKRILI